MALAPTQRPDYSLPELRQELRLSDGPGGDEVRTWIIYDPVRHRYFQISRHAFELLSHWRAVDVESFLDQAQMELDRDIARSDIDDLVKFVLANNLSVEPPGGDARALARQAKSTLRTPLKRLLHGYLFFRLPLINPERFLAMTLPLVSPLFTTTAALLFVSAGLSGSYLVSRQWEAFVATFVDLLSLEGAALYLAVLVVVKALHELGHAYTAARAGVRVHVMGIAFMLMTPMLYTDVSDAWRLRERRDKLAIDAAGIVVELALAGIALLLWAFVPDGPLRSAAFMIATTGLVMGLVINLNPLMKFDGYYLLSDAWRMPNLQGRSNALAQWWLRETLFGLDRAPPEELLRGKRAMVILYAVCAWVYRLFLFLGIALLVYHAFFKTLGVILFAVEIVWFILLPVYRETKEWWSMRKDIAKSRRSLVTAVVTIAAVAVLLVPWSGTIRLQGLALAHAQITLFAPRAARIESIAVGDRQSVLAGEVAMVLSAPDLEHEVEQARRRINLTLARLQRIAGDEADRADRVVLEGELERHRAELAGFMAELGRLVITIPLDGIVRDLDPDLQRGDWIGETSPIARVVGDGKQQVVGYVSEHDVWRISHGAAATFVPEDAWGSRRDAEVIEIATAGVRAIDHPYLASVYGGAVPSDRSADGEVKPRSGLHLVRLQLEGPPLKRAERGTVHISGRRESIAAALVRRVLQVLIREMSA